jgi:hypothetical protein
MIEHGALTAAQFKDISMATAYDPKPVPPKLSKALIHKISALPRERIAEVEDFVDFITMKDGAMKDGERALTRAAAATSAPAFAAVWNNPEDDVYDSI